MPDNTLKYTRAEKLKIVKEHVDDGLSYDELSKKYGLATSTIKYQVRLYLAHGDKAFISEATRKYTREEKLKAIKRHNDGESYGLIAIDMCLSDPSIVKDWYIKYLNEGEEGIQDTFSRKAYKHHDDKVLEREYKKLLEDLERTKAENEFLKNHFPSSQKKQTIKEKVMVVQELRGQFQLSLLLKTAGISKQIYYYEIKHINDKNKKDKFYEDLILEIFHNNYDKYGIPRITIELNHRLEEMGITRVNHKKVERLMKKLDIQARPKTRGYKSFKGEFGKKCKNQLLDKKIDEKTNLVIYSRNFFTDNIFQKIGTDITVFIMPFGRLYLSPIIDFHSREVLAYNLSENPNYKQIQDMFVDLINKHGDSISGAILQSDMGWQYQMQKYHDKLEELKIIQSMSRKGNCLDNSPTENFFGRMKEEMFYGKEYLYKNMSQLKEAIIRYIEYYNKERIVVKLGMSPYRYRLSLQNNCNLV